MVVRTVRSTPTRSADRVRPQLAGIFGVGSASDEVGSLPRLSFTPSEAAAIIGVSRSFFYEHLMPYLRVVRIGRKRLILLTELERYLDRQARLAVDW